MNEVGKRDAAGSKLLQVRGLSKLYQPGGFHALRTVDLDFDAGETIAITGASGSGKSTLLHLCGGLERPTTGQILLRGRELQEKDLDQYRATEVGFVFQSFHLLEVLTVAENVQMPLFESRLPRAQWRDRALQLLELTGMAGHADKLPSQLSGGERQRVAIARSLVNQPSLLLADEPTGNLDSANAQKILELLAELQKQRGATLILVTHDPTVAAFARRNIRLHDGRVVEDVRR